MWYPWYCFIFIICFECIQMVSVIRNHFFPIFIFWVMITGVFELWCVSDQQKSNRISEPVPTRVPNPKVLGAWGRSPRWGVQGCEAPRKKKMFTKKKIENFSNIFFFLKVNYFFLKSSETYQNFFSFKSNKKKIGVSNRPYLKN